MNQIIQQIREAEVKATPCRWARIGTDYDGLFFVEDEDGIYHSYRENDSNHEFLMLLRNSITQLLNEYEAMQDALRQIKEMEPEVSEYDFQKDVDPISVVDDTWRSKRDNILSDLKSKGVEI